MKRKEIGVQNPKTRKHNVKERIHLQLYEKLGDEKMKMKMNVDKEFCDWTIEDMVEYVLTGRKPKCKIISNLVKCHKTVLG